jgi:hypothetical protein
MKTVICHRYAQATGTEVFNDPLGDLVALLPANTWIGVTEESDGWYHVITAQVNGWIRKEECTSGKHVTLSPVVSDDRPNGISDYAISA